MDGGTKLLRVCCLFLLYTELFCLVIALGSTGKVSFILNGVLFLIQTTFYPRREKTLGKIQH